MSKERSQSDGVVQRLGGEESRTTYMRSTASALAAYESDLYLQARRKPLYGGNMFEVALEEADDDLNARAMVGLCDWHSCLF